MARGHRRASVPGHRRRHGRRDALGVITAVLQTKMGVNSLLAGIIVNTGLYSINIAIMGNSSSSI
ncbi:MAG: hypothetical protein V8S89_04480 [Oscillospiraceae bacterium]